MDETTQMTRCERITLQAELASHLVDRQKAIWDGKKYSLAERRNVIVQAVAAAGLLIDETARYVVNNESPYPQRKTPGGRPPVEISGIPGPDLGEPGEFTTPGGAEVIE